jgi:DNA-3-methyladenine glycosylase
VIIEREFYLRNALEVAQDLLGTVLVHETEEGTVRARIVEVEAYIGSEDAASHAYKNRNTARTAVQFGPGGYAYVYLIYGMHYCMNIVTNHAQKPEAVLLRALEPLEGIEIMKKRRNTDNIYNLCGGPGKLCAAMKIDRTCYGMDLCNSNLYLEYGQIPIGKDQIRATRRINVDYAGEAREYLWRYIVEGNPFISVKNHK